MNREGRGGLMLVLGAMLLQLVRSGGFGSFVQQHMRWPLGAAGVVLVVLGVYDMRRADRERRRGGRLRGAAPLVGWLMLLPIAVLVAVAPAALGSDAATRAEAYEPDQRGNVFPPLPDSEQPIEMTMFEFIDRALWDPHQGLVGRSIVVEAFVVNDERYSDGVLLTRFMVSCCAADGLPLQVGVPTSRELEDDTWLRATIEWIPGEGDASSEIVEAKLLDFVELDEAPDSPYESPY